MTQSSSSLQGAIAATRFGLGAKPGEIRRASADAKGFLKAQIRPQGADQPVGQLKSGVEMLAAFGDYKDARKQVKQAGDKGDPMALRDQKRDAYKQMRETGEWPELLAREQLAATTDAGFRERWTRFWSNHFTVSGVKPVNAFLTGPFEREAIRPYVFGRFEDMLVASTSHPGMLSYLDQASSAGPNSPAAGGGRRGLNENLAREIMELHTVGLGAGYTQADVTEFARALTGWSYDTGQGDIPPKAFLFRQRAHEPGARTVLGRTYAPGDEGQARAILHDLAVHPETGRHIGRKLAIHFVADDPPPALVDRLAKAFSGSGGRLDVVAATLIDSPEAWAAPARKFKTPSEFIVSSWRALGHVPNDPRDPIRYMQALGQKPMAAPSPAGWSEEAAGWAAPAELVKRITVAEQLVRQSPASAEPQAVAAEALGPLLSTPVATAMARAETRPQAVAILLMSPEFQRR